MIIEFFVPGLAKPGGSKKGFVNPKTKRVIITEDCKQSKPWRSDVKAFAQKAYTGPPLDGPLEITAIFYMPRPKGHFGSKGMVRMKAPLFPTTKPDATKLWRSTEDALKAVLWNDDSQVVSQFIHKRYADSANPPGARIWVGPAEVS